jgi:glycosyltransferase involved in cell wall biosynthesis
MSSVPDEVIDVSVVIPVRDAAGTIGDQLEALRTQAWSGRWEVIVADNGSRDGTAAMVAALTAADARFRLVDASAVVGPAAARNAGAAVARGRMLAFCDADDLVSEGWLRGIAEGLRSADAVTGPQEQDHLNPPWVAGVYGRAVETGPQWFEGIFPYGPSANLGIRREVFEALGGFDESLLVGEDLELCLRLWQRDHELAFSRDATVHYRNRGSLVALFRQAVRYGGAGPLIARRLRDENLPRPPRFRRLRNVLWLLRNVTGLADRPRRARWVVVAGEVAGRVLGSWRHRTLYL